ncbi:MAG TPA: PEP-CTERM sorting domain-containing protein, partial [Croceibacterium sp.]|nr:PEP-CTERM sorting domain-containing protein [Croceibacterium sp.]
TMNKLLVGLAAAALSALTAGAAYAAPTTFFGQDQNPGSSTINSDAAHTQFLSNLSSGVGTENFEGIAGGNYGSLALTFPGSTGNITANLSGSLLICTTNGCGGAGRFATSGTHYLDTTDNFTLTFSSPISAFGFYATDLGDINGDLTLLLTGGGTVNFTVPTAGSADGNQLFWGFIDPLQSYSGIQFGNTASGSDFFGFDDMIIGDLGQVQIGVPEPGALAMLGMGLLGMLSLVLLRRRLD